MRTIGWKRNAFRQILIYDPAWGYTTAVSNAFRSLVSQRSWNFEPQLEFTRRLGPGDLQVLGGLTFQERTAHALQLSGTGFANNNLIDNLSAATTVYILADSEVLYRYNAIFGRLNYNIDGKYILNLTGRRDGSSRFGPGKRFANFGAVGGAWIFSKEKIFADMQTALSFGKLRGSYGTTGSDQIGDYQYLSTYQATGVPYQGVVGLQPVRLFNPDFSWETNKKLEFAVELGFLKDRLYLTAAHYRNRSSSQLVGIPLPTMTGFPSIQANLDATVQNTGWEFDFRTIILDTGKWNWTASANVTFARNKLLRYDGLESSTYAEQYIIGQPLDIVKVYHNTGVDQQTGLYTFQDYNGDGQITWPEDSQKIVSLTPDYYGGLQNSLSYKNWSLDFLLQFVKQQGYNHFNTGAIPGLPDNQPAAVVSAWQSGSPSDIQLYTAGYNNEALDAFYNFIGSDGVISDASFLRLKNLSISYTLPKEWLPSTSCRLYFQGQNLLTLTKFKGADPENQTRGSLPPLRTLSFGVQIDFQP
ncbi:TonB-dependent receptor [Flavobacterium sp.]|uniref:TonB-dependent receptor n=1 Tax=Flavobacterium sp. TaxID=239 RepID=UPI00262A9662|nr:TonB-dependent receptor [Flavobacterium sp.]